MRSTLSLPILTMTVFSFIPLAQAEEQVAPPSEVSGESAASNADTSTLSKPENAPEETAPAGQGPDIKKKPSQGEGEKAPVQERPTAVPEFSLPEVVITGENELTIGAKRSERKADDVTLGSRDLSGLERTLNDLPGLSKTFTALATEEAGPSKDTALILHLGGGLPGTYGGWGLFGQEFPGFHYLLTGHYSTWAGQTSGSGLDGDIKQGFGAETKFDLSKTFRLLLSGGLDRVDAELPYQSSLRELHDGFHLNGTAQVKLSDLVQVQATLFHQATSLTYWDSGARSNQVRELEARFKISADDVDPFLDRLLLELGGRRADSDLSASYDWAWANLQGHFKHGDNLGLAAKLQAQGGNGMNLPFRFYPALNLMWRAFESSQVNLYWQTDRFVDNFHTTFMETEHITPRGGFPSPTEIADEWGIRFTQKVSEKIVVSLSGSTASINDHHQWTDVTPAAPSFIEAYSSLAQVQMNKVGANIQWSFQKDWQLAASYQWTQGLNRSGDGRDLTHLPQHRGVLSLYRGDDKLETRLELAASSQRRAFDNAPGDLPAYYTLGLDAAYHITKTFSLWLNGDNLSGEEYQLQPGYLEPKFHVRGGVEIIF